MGARLKRAAVREKRLQRRFSRAVFLISLLWPKVAANVGMGVRKALFPPEKADRQPCAKRGQAQHHAGRQQNASCTVSQKGVLHHRNSLRQREEADDFLHDGRHDLDRQRRAGKDQHGEIEDVEYEGHCQGYTNLC